MNVQKGAALQAKGMKKGQMKEAKECLIWRKGLDEITAHKRSAMPFSKHPNGTSGDDAILRDQLNILSSSNAVPIDWGDDEWHPCCHVRDLAAQPVDHRIN